MIEKNSLRNMPVNTEGKKQIFKTKTEIIFLTHLFLKKMCSCEKFSLKNLSKESDWAPTQ